MSNRIKLYRTDAGYEIRQYKTEYDAGEINAEQLPYDLILRVEEIGNTDIDGRTWPNKVFLRGLREFRNGSTDKWGMRFGYFLYVIVIFENGKVLFSPNLDTYETQKEFAEKLKTELQFADEQEYVEIDDIVF